jgi:hypothetical protein
MAASKAVVEAFAGGVGSLVALFSTYPLKTIYTLQASNAAGCEGWCVGTRSRGYSHGTSRAHKLPAAV